MQLIRAVGLGAVLVSTSCESGGISIEMPAAPDAPAGGSTPTGGLDGGTAGEGGLDGLDGAGLDDGGSQGDGSPGDGSPGDGGDRPSTLIPSGAMWRVSDATPSGWTQPDFDDSAWDEREAPLGAVYDVAGAWPSAGGSTYLRHAFDGVFEADDVLELRLRRDDGAIAYLDGVEVGRWNVAAGTSGSSASVLDEVQGTDGYTYFVSMPAPPANLEGPHVLAVEVHQRTDPDFVFDARLRRVGDAQAIDNVLVQVRTRSYGGSYAPDNVGAIWIEDANGAFVRSLVVWANVRREHLVSWFSSSNDDRVDAMTSATASSHHSRFVEWDLRDATGALVPDGSYVARFEITESNSNQGAPAGPTLAIPFSTAERCRAHTGSSASLDDVVVVTPCP